MNILFFVSSLYGGGAERIVTYIANYLSKDNNVYIADFSDNNKTYPINQEIKIIDIRAKGKLKIFSPFIKLNNIHKVIKETNPDIIISFSVSLNYSVLLVNKFAKKKIIVSERTSLNRYISRKAEFTRNVLYKSADSVVLVSNEDYNNAKHLNNKAVIYNPLFFETYKENTNRDNVIIAIGSTKRWHVKGFDLLLKAWKKIEFKYPNWTLEFMGKRDSNEFDNLISELELQKRVHFIGHKDNVEQELRKKSIYVLSSRYEGFPNSLTEAMSQGCACLAFNCSTGPKEIIQDGRSGILAKELDINDLSEKLAILIENEELRKKLSSEAKIEVGRFSPDKILEYWETLINKVVYENNTYT